MTDTHYLPTVNDCSMNLLKDKTDQIIISDGRVSNR